MVVGRSGLWRHQGAQTRFSPERAGRRAVTRGGRLAAKEAAGPRGPLSRRNGQSVGSGGRPGARLAAGPCGPPSQPKQVVELRGLEPLTPRMPF